MQRVQGGSGVCMGKQLPACGHERHAQLSPVKRRRLNGSGFTLTNLIRFSRSPRPSLIGLVGVVVDVSIPVLAGSRCIKFPCVVR